MTKSEVTAELMRLRSIKEKAHQEMRQFCRTIVPILKDRGLPSLAEQLAAKIFKLDAVDGQVVNTIRGNSDAFFEILAECSTPDVCEPSPLEPGSSGLPK